MNDQAQNLRRMVVERQENSSRNTKVISVISGKGGVGKSNISLNFSLALAEQGKKVLLFDLDIGMANLDILMGISSSSHVVDMIERDQMIWDIMIDGPLGLKVVAGGSGLSTVFSMNNARQEHFSKQMALLDGIFDFIVFDMGAGASSDSLHFILSSHETFVITTPEPTSITDAYSMLKYIHAKDPNLPSSVLINRSESRREGEQTAENLARAAARFLQKDLSILGSIPQDNHVLKAVKAQTPFYLAYPSSPAAKALKRCTTAFIGSRRDKEEKLSSYQHFMGKLKKFLTRGSGGD